MHVCGRLEYVWSLFWFLCDISNFWCWCAVLWPGLVVLGTEGSCILAFHSALAHLQKQVQEFTALA